jgi:hypothetical protein
MGGFSKDAAVPLPLSSGPGRNILPNALPEIVHLFTPSSVEGLAKI